MPTVPNWIGHSVVILPSRNSLRADRAYRVTSWRATKTQVVVTLDTPNRTEARFYLDGLVGVGGDRGAALLDATDPVTVKRGALINSRRAVAELETVMALARLDRIRSDPEALATEIGRIRDAATAALASLAEVL
jgi:hypothetical protein